MWFSGRMLSALRSSRDFRLLMAGELVSRSGTAASFVAVWSVAEYELHVSTAVLSLIMVSNTVPRVITSMVAGRMVDRHGPRLVLIFANVLGLLGSVLQWASPNAFALCLASMVAGVGFGAFMPAIGSMAPRVVDDEHLLPANALMELCWQIGFIFGPLAGAGAILAGGVRAPLLFDAATFVVGIACVIPIVLRPVRHPEVHEELAEEHEGDGFIRGLRYTWSLPIARFVLVLNCGMFVGISFFMVLEPVYVSQVLHAEAFVLGLLQTAFGIGAVLGAVVAARAERRVGPRLLALSIGMCGTGMIWYTATGTLAIAAAGVAWWGLGIGLWAPIGRTMIHRGVPMSRHGRVNGVMSTAQSMLEVLPVLAAGQLAGLIGIQTTLVAAGVTSIVLGVWGLVAARHIAYTPGPVRAAVAA